MMMKSTKRQQSAKEIFPELIFSLTDGRAKTNTVETSTKQPFRFLSLQNVWG